MREYRIDFFRGLALITIFINHIPFNTYGRFTPRNFGLSDAAETFVLIAGISAAYAYYPRFRDGDWAGATARVVKRAFTIYVAQFAGTLAFVALFVGLAAWFADPAIYHQNAIAELLDDPIRAWFGVATLLHQVGYFNILPVYIVILLMLPFFMGLARWSLAAAFLASFLLYAIAASFRLNLPLFPLGGGWYMSPLAWQFLFVVGFVAGAGLKDGRPMPYSPWIFWPALAYVVVTGAWVYFGLTDYSPDLPLPFVLAGNDKTYLTANRLIHVLALAYVVGFSGIAAWLRPRLSGRNPVVMLGRHSLAIFCVGSFLSMIGLILRPELNGDIGFDTLVTAGGLAILFGLAAILEARRKARIAPRSAAIVAAEPATGLAPEELTAAE